MVLNNHIACQCRHGILNIMNLFSVVELMMERAERSFKNNRNENLEGA
jgi:hypothetical protein